MTAGIRVSVTQPSAPASMEHRVAIWFSRFFNMNSPVILLGPCPRGPHPGDGVGHHCMAYSLPHNRQSIVLSLAVCTAPLDVYRSVKNSGKEMLRLPFLFHITEQLQLLSLTLSPPIPLRLYTLPYWFNPPFSILDIRALWRLGPVSYTHLTLPTNREV